MLYTKIQLQSFIVLLILKWFLAYMGLAAILFNGAKQFEETDNTSWPEGPM